MKICAASIFILSFLSIGFSRELYAIEKKCATKYGVPLTILDKFYEYVVCDFEEIKVPLRQFLICCLESKNIMNEKGELIQTNEKVRELIKTIPEIEDKNEFTYILVKKLTLEDYRAVPPNCKGNLTKAWLKCAKDNGLPEYNTEETLQIIKESTEPSKDFKKFLLCGLKDQEILTENGDLNMKSLGVYKYKDFILKTAYQTVDYQCKADFAYKITKSIVLDFKPEDSSEQRDNETDTEVET